MQIKNYLEAEIYRDYKGSYEQKDIEQINEWLRSHEIEIEIVSDADGETLRIFKK